MKHYRNNPELLDATRTVKPWHVNGYEVQTYGGERYTTVAWYPTPEAAIAERNRRLASNTWQGMPPRVVKS